MSGYVYVGYRSKGERKRTLGDCKKEVLRKKQEKQGDTIKVAINKVEPGKVIRPEFLIFSSGYITYTVIWIVILCVLILIDMIIAYKEHKKGYVISITTSDTERK